MEREEHWRRRLIELKDALNLSQADIAGDLGIAPSYVSRLFYPPDKAGRKNLGLDTLMALRKAYSLPADWFDLPAGAALPGNVGALSVQEPAAIYRIDARPAWPFTLVTHARLMELKVALGSKGVDAIRDIDQLLDVAVIKWERVAQQKKNQHRKS